MLTDESEVPRVMIPSEEKVHKIILTVMTSILLL